MRTIRQYLIAAFLLGLPIAITGQTWQERLYAETDRKVQIEYDRFKDVTTVRFPDWPAVDAKGKTVLGIGHQMFVMFPGKDPVEGIEYFLNLSVAQQMVTDPGLILIADGEIIAFEQGKGIASNEHRVARGVLAGLARETGRVTTTGRVSYPMTLAELQRLSEFKTIEFQFGRIEAFFSPKFHRDLSAAITILKE